MARKPASRKPNTKMTTEAAAATETQPKTLEQRLEAAKVLVAKLEAEINVEKIKGDIQKDDDVDFTFGRGDSKTTLTGTVLGTADTDQGKIVAVSVLDELGLPDVKRVNVRAILANRTADKRREPVAEEGGANADVVPFISAGDPLDAE